MAMVLLTSIVATAVSTWYAVDAHHARQIADHRLRMSQADFERATQAVDMVIQKVGINSLILRYGTGCNFVRI